MDALALAASATADHKRKKLANKLRARAHRFVPEWAVYLPTYQRGGFDYEKRLDADLLREAANFIDP